MYRRSHIILIIAAASAVAPMVQSSSSWSRISRAVVSDLLLENLRLPALSLPGYHSKESASSESKFDRDDDCGANLTNLSLQSSGTIETPNYPDKYPGLSQCEWVLESEPGTIIQATFFDIVTQPWTVVFFDYISVSDTGDWDQFHRFSGDLNRIMPYTIVSQSNKLKVRFVSSYLINFRGFKMSYAVVPAAPLNSTETPSISVIDEEGNVQNNILAAMCDYDPIVPPPSPTEPENKFGDAGSRNYSSIKIGLWSSDKQNFQRGNSVHRIVSGSEVSPHQYPFMTALLIDDKYFCGGSLIDNQHVLTAAHCVDGASKVEIFLGAYDLSQNEDSQVQQTVNSSLIHQHPHFDPETGVNDIAIVRLAELVTFNSHIQPIYLPSPASMSNSFTNYKLITMGWGEVNKSNEIPSISPILRKASASIIPNSLCKQTFKDVLTGNSMCSSGSRGDSPCHGDSGSPLVAPFHTWNSPAASAKIPADPVYRHQCVYSDPSRSSEYNTKKYDTNWFVQLGVLSVGSSSCGSSAPKAFTRLTAYLDFIKKVRSLRGHEFKSSRLPTLRHE